MFGAGANLWEEFDWALRPLEIFLTIVNASCCAAKPEHILALFIMFWTEATMLPVSKGVFKGLAL